MLFSLSVDQNHGFRKVGLQLALQRPGILGCTTKWVVIVSEVPSTSKTSGSWYEKDSPATVPIFPKEFSH